MAIYGFQKMNKDGLLRNFLNCNVEVIFNDGQKVCGVLGYTTQYSAKFGFRKPNYFTVQNYDFKASHIKAIRRI